MRASRLLLLVLVASLAARASLADEPHQKRLADAVKAKDAGAVQEACDALAAAGGKAGVLAILAQVPKAEGDLYWPLVRAAASFEDRPALEELGRQVVALQGQTRTCSGDLLFALQRNASPDVAAPLAHVLEKGKYELQLMAANHLAFVRSSESVDALIASWKREQKGDSELGRRVQGALETLAERSFGSPADAEAWWKEQRSTGLGKPGGEVEKPRDREFKTVERGRDERIVVLSSDRRDCEEDPEAVRYDLDFDKIDEILERRKIPHVVVKKHAFEKDPSRYLEGCRALLVNCNLITKYCVCPTCTTGQVKKGAQSERLSYGCNPGCSDHVNVSQRLSERSLKRIRAWVEDEGGYLYSEDWGIVEILAPLWPDHVASGTREKTASGEIVDRPIAIRGYDKTGRVLPSWSTPLAPRRGNASHPLMRGVWHDPDHPTTRLIEHRWQIDDESPAIEVKDAKNVVVLLESPGLEAFAKGNNAVAVTFRPGSKAKAPASSARATGEWALTRSGRVLHTLSHFGKQSSTEDGEALENLLVNFLLEADRRHQGK